MTIKPVRIRSNDDFMEVLVDSAMGFDAACEAQPDDDARRRFFIAEVIHADIVFAVWLDYEEGTFCTECVRGVEKLSREAVPGAIAKLLAVPVANATEAAALAASFAEGDAAVSTHH